MSADHPSQRHAHRRSPDANPLHDILESAARCAGGGVEWRGSSGLTHGLALAAAPACERCRRTTPAFYLRCMAEVRPALGPGDAHLCAHGQGIRVTHDGRLLIIAPANRLRNFAAHLESLLAIEQQPPATEDHLAATVRSLIAAVDAKDTYTRGHSERVHLAACALGEALNLDAAARTDLYWASLLHDVGKIGAPDHILKKPGRLTPEEYQVMQEHPVRGDELLAPLTWLGGARRGVRHHHERFDGTGYPDRLAGESIPIIARIISVADTFDAVVSRRSYRDARDAEPALEVLREAAGTQLDPDVVAAFVERFAAIAATLSASAFPPEGLRTAASADQSQRRAA